MGTSPHDKYKPGAPIKLHPPQLSVIKRYAERIFIGGKLSVHNESYPEFLDLVLSLPNCRDFADSDVISVAVAGVLHVYRARRGIKKDAAAGADLGPQIADYVIRFLESLPRSYIVSATLPGIQGLSDFSLELSNRIRLKSTAPVSQKSGNALMVLLQKELPAPATVVVEVDVQGFATDSLGSQGVAEAVALLKQVSYLLVSTGVLHHNPARGGRSDVAVHDLLDHSVEQAKVPDRFARYLGALELDTGALEIFDGSMGTGLLGSFRKPATPAETVEALQSKLATISRFYSRNVLPGFDRVSAAIEWYQDSNLTEDQTMAFLAACIGLESIFGEDKGLDELSRRLVDRYSFMLGATRADRIRLAQEFQGVLNLRGELVHARSARLRGRDREKLATVRSMLRNSIQHELGPFLAS